MRISDWSSDVCSSDLRDSRTRPGVCAPRKGTRGDIVLVRSRRKHRGRLARKSAGQPFGRNDGSLDQGDVGTLCAEKMTCSRRSEEHTSELQSLMRISYAVFCLKKKNYNLIYHLLHYYLFFFFYIFYFFY